MLQFVVANAIKLFAVYTSRTAVVTVGRHIEELDTLRQEQGGVGSA